MSILTIKLHKAIYEGYNFHLILRVFLKLLTQDFNLLVIL